MIQMHYCHIGGIALFHLTNPLYSLRLSYPRDKGLVIFTAQFLVIKSTSSNLPHSIN